MDNKVDSVCDLVEKISSQGLNVLRPTMRGTWEQLIRFDGIGSFLAGQVVADLAHLRAGREWPDRDRWAPLGPGSARGINRLRGIPKDKAVRQDDFERLLPELIEPCILAGCPEQCCGACGAAWSPEVERVDRGYDGSKYGERAVAASGGVVTGGTARSTLGSSNGKQVGQRVVKGYAPSCECNAPSTAGVVLDPFGGAGTTGLVADRHHRDAILIELNPDYAEMARRRIRGEAPLLAQVEAA